MRRRCRRCAIACLLSRCWRSWPSMGGGGEIRRKLCLMFKSNLQPQRIARRAWRPRHPLRCRPTPLRRRTMTLAALLLWGIIGAYAYYTNEWRVRALAADYLAALLGGEVRIGGADLSFFEGLRLDSVQVLSPAGANQPPLLQAGTVYI